VLSATRGALQDAGLPVSGLPREIRTVEHATTGTPVMLRTRRDGDLEPVTRPAAAAAEVVPADIAAARQVAAAATASAAEREALGQRRLDEARRLAHAEQLVLRADGDAEQLRAAAEEDREHGRGPQSASGTAPRWRWPRRGAAGLVTHATVSYSGRLTGWPTRPSAAHARRRGAVRRR